MSDILADGESFLIGRLKAGASQTVTYRRGTGSVSIAATIGRSDAIFTGDFGGTSYKREDLAFIAEAADLVINGTTIEPIDGDTIDYGGRRYRVSKDGTQPAFEYDASRVSIRILTKFKGAV